MHTEEHARQMFDQWAMTGRIESDEIGRTGTGDRFDILRLLCNALTDDDNRMPREVSEKFASNGAEGMLWSYRDGATAVTEVMDLVLSDNNWLDHGRHVMEMVSETTVT